MNSRKVEQALKKILEEKGEAILQNRPAFRSAVSDSLDEIHYPEERLVLKHAMDANTFWTLLGSGQLTADGAQRAAEQLAKESHMAREDAEFVVRCVAAARGVDLQAAGLNAAAQKEEAKPFRKRKFGKKIIGAAVAAVIFLIAAVAVKSALYPDEKPAVRQTADAKQTNTAGSLNETPEPTKLGSGSSEAYSTVEEYAADMGEQLNSDIGSVSSGKAYASVQAYIDAQQEQIDEAVKSVEGSGMTMEIKAEGDDTLLYRYIYDEAIEVTDAITEYFESSMDTNKAAFEAVLDEMAELIDVKSPKVKLSFENPDGSIVYSCVVTGDDAVSTSGNAEPLLFEEAGGNDEEANILMRDGGRYVNSLILERTPDNVLKSEISRTDICTISFLDTLDAMPDKAWDVSWQQDGSVMAWIEPNSKNADMYDLFIGGEGGVTGKDCTELFKGYENLEKIEFNDCFDTSRVYSMRSMFGSCYSLAQLDVSGFDTGRVKDMSKMFAGCKKLTELDLSKFNTSQVTDMLGMFYECTNLTKLDVSGFDTSQVENMNRMFEGCTNLTKLDVSGFDTSQVESMNRMFEGCGVTAGEAGLKK